MSEDSLLDDDVHLDEPTELQVTSMDYECVVFSVFAGLWVMTIGILALTTEKSVIISIAVIWAICIMANVALSVMIYIASGSRSIAIVAGIANVFAPLSGVILLLFIVWFVGEILYVQGVRDRRSPSLPDGCEGGDIIAA